MSAKSATRRFLAPAGVIALVAMMAVAPGVMGSAYWYAIFTTVIINVLLATSLRTIFLVGRISLGHVGFMLVGAYGSALLSMRLGWPLWATIPVASLMAAAVALIVAYPFLRVAGVYFAMLTLLAAETLRLVAFNWKSMTGASFGLSGIPGPGPLHIPLLGTIEFGRVDRYYYLALLVVVPSLVVLYLLERSDLGLKWRAIRDGEPLAQSVGIPVMTYKMANFVIACFFAGLAGALYAHGQRGLDAEATSRFGGLMSMYLVVYMVVGGEGPFLGPAVGATLLTLISQLANSAKEYQPIVVGVIAILATIAMPDGIAGGAGRAWRRWGPAAARAKPREVEHAGAGDS
jgi:branched-chain amino acid transport system permease protein